VQKMSKSYGNYVGITEAPQEMFGKLMSISDELMWRYYELLTDETTDGIERMKADVAAGKLHPMRAKKDLAKRIVADFHSATAAEQAEADWTKQFQKDEVPTNLEEVKLAATELHASADGERTTKLAPLLVHAGLAASNAEASRKVKEGAVSVDGDKVAELYLRLPNGVNSFVLRVGKRMKRVVLE